MERKRHVVIAVGDGCESINRLRFQQGIVEYGRDKGWMLTRGECDADDADGVIVYGIDGKAVAGLDRKSEGLPVVWGQRERPARTLGAVLDDREIGRVGAKHFAGAGFRRLGFLLGKGAAASNRWKGFCEAALAMGMESPMTLDVRGIGKTRRDVLRDLGKQLGSSREPTGVMAATDRDGVEVLNAAGVAGVKVPEQVAVLGVGNDEAECGFGPVGLSSVRVNARQQGLVAAGVLDRMMAGEDFEAGEIVIGPGEVVVRRSSDVRAVPHLKAAMALQYIRRNYGEAGLSVDRVAEAVGMSRRGLEDAFRNHLSQGIGRTITETRIRFAKEMLAATRRNVSEVSLLVGFRNNQYFHRCFSKMVGMTPARFRRLKADEGNTEEETADGDE